MTDLKIAPMNENAKFCYGTIMDFLDDFDSQKAVSFVKGPVEATFFENKNTGRLLFP